MAVPKSSSSSSNGRRFVKSVSSLGSGTLHEDEQVVACYTPSSCSTTNKAPLRQTSTLSTTLVDSISSTGSSSSETTTTRTATTSTITTGRTFEYEYNDATGLPIFDIDQCDDEELLGGEPSPLHDSVTRQDELSAVKELRSQLSVSATHETQELTDPRMIVRHFRAEKGNTAKALETLRDALQWRRDFETTALRVCMNTTSTSSPSPTPSSSSPTNTAKKDYQAMMRLENETGKIFVRGTTLEGRALMYMFAMRNNTKSDVDNMRHLVWNLEKAIRVTHHKSQGRLDKYCLLIDCANYSLAKAPSMQASKMTLDVLQTHFKERMHRIYVLNPPLAFRIFWNMVKHFIDPVTKSKIVFCTSPDSEGVQQLLNDVGPAQAQRLEPCAFGTQPIRPFDSKVYLELPMHIGFDDDDE